MTTQFYAYVHARPDGSIFYVGKGKNTRPHDLSPRNKYHAAVVRKYGSENILIGTIPCSTEAIAFDLERGLIKCLRRMGASLSNMTDGGEGASGAVRPQHLKDAMRGNKYSVGRSRSESHKKAISLAQKGNQHTKGRKPTEEELLRRSESAKGKPSHMRGKKHPEHVKSKISKSLKGRASYIRTAETLLKLSTSVKASMTQEARENLRQKNLGKKLSEESKRKISEATSRLNANPEHRAKVSASVKGSRWMNNLHLNKRVLPENQYFFLEQGWKFGKVKR